MSEFYTTPYPSEPPPWMPPPLLPPPPPPKSRTKLYVILSVLLTLVVVGAAGAAVLLLTGKDHHAGSAAPSATRPSGTPTTFTARGTLTITASFDIDLGWSGVTHTGSYCSGADGYDDLAEGTQVTIEANGQVVGYGTFGAGNYSYGLHTCTFHWAVRGLPSNKPRYAVNVTTRGRIFYQQYELESGEASLTIGGN